MNMKVINMMLVLFVAMAFGLAGCGGGGGSSDAATGLPVATGPAVTAFTLPSTSTSLTVAITSFTGTDSTGVTGYYVSENSTTPTSGVSGWSLSTPANYTFTSAGSKTLYAWVKNAAGQVSSSQSASVTISITTTVPTVTAFTIPSTSTSVTVPITSFTGTDSTGVTGYYVAESSTPPSLIAGGWSSLTPTSYIFTSAGSKTLYAWVKNAAGQVSSSQSASVVITLPIPPHNLSEIAGTWQITTPTGSAGTFDVADDGTITNLRMMVTVSTTCFGYSNNYTGGCGAGSQNIDLIFGTIAINSSFTFSGNASATYQTMSTNGTFVSPSMITGTYSASYSHSVDTSTGGYQISGSGNGSWTAIPTGTPSFPKGVKVTKSGNQILVSWTPVAGATSYNIYYGTSTGVTIGNGTKITGAASGRDITSLSSVAKYFVVTAVNSGGESPTSTETFLDSRFIDKGNGTVYDTVSNLTWLRNADCLSTQGWNDAMTKSNNLASGQCGLTDGSSAGNWRLPSVAELRTFYDSGLRWNTLSAVVFSNVSGIEAYWSSSSAGGSLYWGVQFGPYATVDAYSGIDGKAWPVRSGQF